MHNNENSRSMIQRTRKPKISVLRVRALTSTHKTQTNAGEEASTERDSNLRL